MIRPLELQIGLRYTRARRENRFISFISFISIFGIVIGVWALITVLSIMNGFERELRERILAVASHITITGETGQLANWQEVADQVGNLDDVIGYAPFILGQGMVVKGGTVSGALIRGISPVPESTVSTVTQSMVSGEIDSLT